MRGDSAAPVHSGIDSSCDGHGNLNEMSRPQNRKPLRVEGRMAYKSGAHQAEEKVTCEGTLDGPPFQKDILALQRAKDVNPCFSVGTGGRDCAHGQSRALQE